MFKPKLTFNMKPYLKKIFLFGETESLWKRSARKKKEEKNSFYKLIVHGEFMILFEQEVRPKTVANSNYN